MADAPQKSRSTTLIDALMSAGAYPHPVHDVQLRQTHISWVLLAGEYAYKIKKPVKFGFVDFSTLERRRYYCHEELRLNRRFAPALYVDVVSIGGSPQAPAVDGGTAAIECAVRMRRFAAEDELESLIGRDAVSTRELKAFGRRLADIHETSAVFHDFASAARTFEIASANAAELESALKSGTDELAAVLDYVRQESPRASEAIERRRAAGRVRECHGDLHSGNIVRLDGELTAFDCMEFDPELSRIDVMNDVAFLVMDLAARERPGLAYAFLNGWLERSGDYDGVSLLRFFAVYRAFVRAKIAALRADDRAAAVYIGTASRFACAKKPTLMLTCGLSGSGKTWLSEQLMSEPGALRVRSDVERKRLAGLREDESSRSLAGEGIYTREFNDRVYAILLDCAQLMLLAQQNVIVDAAFLKSAERLAFVELARRLEVPVVILHCTASDEELRRRVQARQHAGRDASEADLAVLQRQAGMWQEFTGPERSVVMEVRTDDPRSVEEASRKLRSS